MEKGDNKKCEQSAGACNDGKFYGRFPNQYITVGKKKNVTFFYIWTIIINVADQAFPCSLQ